MSTYSSPLFPSSIAQSVADYLETMLVEPHALRGQQLRGGGPIAEFERLLMERTGFPFCLATSNATSALLVGALAAQLPGKIIAVEQGAWAGSLGTLEFAGAHVVEVGSLETSLLTEATAILATDCQNKRHNADAIRQVCEKNHILYIEDTNWLPGVTAPRCEYSIADIQVISFGPGKPISIGEGGALLCRNEEIYNRAVAFSQHPERTIAEGNDVVQAPLLNARIHPLAALIGVAILSARIETTGL